MRPNCTWNPIWLIHNYCFSFLQDSANSALYEYVTGMFFHFSIMGGSLLLCELPQRSSISRKDCKVGKLSNEDMNLTEKHSMWSVVKPAPVWVYSQPDTFYVLSHSWTVSFRGTRASSNSETSRLREVVRRVQQANVPLCIFCQHLF